DAGPQARALTDRHIPEDGRGLMNPGSLGKSLHQRAGHCRLALLRRVGVAMIMMVAAMMVMMVVIVAMIMPATARIAMLVVVMMVVVVMIVVVMIGRHQGGRELVLDGCGLLAAAARILDGQRHDLGGKTN